MSAERLLFDATGARMFKTVRAQHGAGDLVAELEYTILPQTDDRSPSVSSGEEEPPPCGATTSCHRTHLHHHNHHHHQLQQQQQQKQQQQHHYQYRYHQHSRDASPQTQTHHHHHRRSSSSSSSSATADESVGGGGGGAGTRRTVVVIIAMLVLGCGVVAAAVLVPILLAARLVTVPSSARLQTFAVAASGVIHSARGDYVQLLPVKHAPPGTVINFGPPPPPLPSSTGRRRKRRSAVAPVVRRRRRRPVAEVRHRKPVRTDDGFRSLDFRISQQRRQSKRLISFIILFCKTRGKSPSFLDNRHTSYVTRLPFEKLFGKRDMALFFSENQIPRNKTKSGPFSSTAVHYSALFK